MPTCRNRRSDTGRISTKRAFLESRHRGDGPCVVHTQAGIVPEAADDLLAGLSASVPAENEGADMRSPAMVVAGVIVALLGLLFMFQGLGVIKGSSMTNSNFWAVAGPLIAVAGVTLVALGARHRRSTGAP